MTGGSLSYTTEPEKQKLNLTRAFMLFFPLSVWTESDHEMNPDDTQNTISIILLSYLVSILTICSLYLFYKQAGCVFYRAILT